MYLNVRTKLLRKELALAASPTRNSLPEVGRSADMGAAWGGAAFAGPSRKLPHRV